PHFFLCVTQSQSLGVPRFTHKSVNGPRSNRRFPSSESHREQEGFNGDFADTLRLFGPLCPVLIQPLPVGSMCTLCSLILILVQILVLVHPATGYNLDQEHSLEFSGPSSSMFGYSVLLHRHKSHRWLVVGAPVANSTSNPSVRSPGVVYRCNVTAESHHCHPMHADVLGCGKTCDPESDHQWLGVSLSRQPGDNGGHILITRRSSVRIMGHVRPVFPTSSQRSVRFLKIQFVFTVSTSRLNDDLIIMGAPGTSYWMGSVLVFNTSSGVMSVYLDEDARSVNFGSYLGYAVGAGNFLSPSTVEVVGGAPQYNQRGKVFIFTVDANMLRVVSEVSGSELGSYFGSSLLAVDLNADGLSDLLVGAPMATGAKLMEAEFQLSGSDAYAARFGETIADLGDIDDDGYPDVAVGAPQEDDLRGAVYIYNGRKDGISPTPSQRITGSTLGRDLRMFGQSLNSGIDIDDNGYNDVAVGAFLSDSAVILRTRPVIQVKASLTLPEHIDQQVALCREHKTPTVCFNVTVCFSVKSRHFKGAIDLQYNLTSDLLHKPSFPHRFYFHGNGSSNSTRGRVRARHGQLTCSTHVAYQRKDVRDIFTPVKFEVSYSRRDTNTHRASSKTFPPLKPILQQSEGHQNTITNQTWFARPCSLVNCSTNMQLSAQLVLPHQHQYFALGSGQTIMVKTSLLNSGDDAFLPRLTLRFPNNIHYIKVLQNQDNVVSCDVTQEVNSTMRHQPPPTSPCPASLDVNPNSTAGDVMIHLNTSSDNYERAEYLHDNSMSLLLPLKYGVNVNIHGFVTPTSFVFGDEDTTRVDCYNERFNYTYKVLNSGPSRSVDTVVDIALPKILAPYRHRLMQVVDWQSSHGVCSISDTTISVNEDCDVPEASFIKQIVLLLLHLHPQNDELCERLGRHGVMRFESTALMSNPRESPHTVLIHEQPAAQVTHLDTKNPSSFTQKPSTTVKVFIIVISLVLGLLILAALIWCLWKAGFFKREFQKKEEEEFKRDSWAYVPKKNERESTS
ncbi:hypothetical protein F7725_002156, partial [Dissostichus mawsoni]